MSTIEGLLMPRTSVDSRALRHAFKIFEHLRSGPRTQLQVCRNAQAFRVLETLIAMGIVESFHRYPKHGSRRTYVRLRRGLR